MDLNLIPEVLQTFNNVKDFILILGLTIGFVCGIVLTIVDWLS